MKQFNASEFISNEETPVVTRNNEPVEIVATTARGCYPIIGYIGDAALLQRWTLDGHFYADVPLNNERNLFFAPKLEVVYVYRFRDDPAGRFVLVHDAKIKEGGRMNVNYTYLGTITGPIVPPDKSEASK